MSTFWILLGFGLMLFVPCFVTMLGSREDKDDSVYSDRFIDETERARAAEAMQAKAAEEATPALAAKAAKPKQAAAEKRAASQVDVIDEPEYPRAPQRGPKTQMARLERAEMDVVRAKAVSARAHAETLAAIARAAAAKAEAAAFEADLAEQAAAQAGQEIRRAA